MSKKTQVIFNFKGSKYKSTISLAWQTNRKYFLFITIAGSIDGLLVYPDLLITKIITDNILKGMTSGNYVQPLQTILILTLITICINQVQQLINDYADVYSNTLSGLIKETINIKLSRKINSLSVPQAENPEIRNTFQKVQDSSGNSIWAIINPLGSFPSIFFGLISTSILF
jgi:hypothetical protein